MQRVAISCKTNAVTRTRNRIKEHGPIFVILNHTPACVPLSGQEAVLVESDKDDWVGWLPVEEIDQNVCEVQDQT